MRSARIKTLLHQQKNAPVKLIDRLKAPLRFIQAARRSWQLALDPWLCVTVFQQFCLLFELLQIICRCPRPVKHSNHPASEMWIYEHGKQEWKNAFNNKVYLCLHLVYLGIHSAAQQIHTRIGFKPDLAPAIHLQTNGSDL